MNTGFRQETARARPPASAMVVETLYTALPPRKPPSTLLQSPLGPGQILTHHFIWSRTAPTWEMPASRHQKLPVWAAKASLQHSKGLTYFVIVDGYKSNAGDFSLDVGLKGTVGACGAVAAVGCCKNTELFSCINEQLESTECGETKGCGWDPAGNKGAGWYACGGKGADPSGKNPLACPNL